MSIEIAPRERVDVVLIGAGVMSATLGTLLRQVDPSLSIVCFESLDRVAAESSDAWNNAGTGHSAFCELNYTPQKSDGSVSISKAIQINQQFQESLQFWTYLVEQGKITCPHEFITKVPHLSFVTTDKSVSFLRKRYEALSRNLLFREMEYTEDKAKIAEWIPLMMEGRDMSRSMAATRVDHGTDVDFGALTRKLFAYLLKGKQSRLFLRHRVTGIGKGRDCRWHVHVKNLQTGRAATVCARFVFIGAGGGALPLLQEAGIDEGSGYGGFPVSGQWLRCVNPEVIEQHSAKVYGKASVGAPPMSVPHLDMRMTGGKKELLFGPYAGFTTKFLKHGSYLDMIKSVRPSNLYPMIKAGLDNVDLTKYLVKEVMQSPQDRLKSLRKFVPNARLEDWELAIAGQRVQIIKSHAEKGGVLEFGTEVIRDKEGSIAALLGASPGASTAVSIMLGMLQKGITVVKPELAKTRLAELIPSFGRKLDQEPALLDQITAQAHTALRIG
ncbi:MAG: malate dehydrogenase (quinone) [Acidobacteriaceae bacterium]|nr:malate dehydrogenase (quinone) [Acidobacteriaceae bacterium]